MICGKFHKRECKKRSINYFECGKVGNFKRDCPLLVQSGSSERGIIVPRNQSGSRNLPLSRQVTTDSSPTVGRGKGSVVAVTPQQGQNAQQNPTLT